MLNLGLGVPLGAARAQAAAAPSRTEYRVPPGMLGDVLATFGRQAGIVLEVDPALVQNRRSPGLRGAYTLPEALGALLAGQGLAVVRAGADAYTLRPQAAAGQATLAGVTVTGARAGRRRPDDINQRVSRGSALFGTADLREVPFTVNVVTSAEIDNRIARTLGEALAGDPAVRNDYGGTGAYPTESFNIRGFQLGGGSAFLKDGVPTAGQVTYGVENVEQLEVVRGPVGFRYGYLPPGGAINLVSKRPTDTPLRVATLNTDQYGSVKGALDVGGRAGPGGRLGYRLNGAAEHQNLFFKPATKDRLFGSAALDYRVSDGTTVRVNYDANDYDAGPDIFHYTGPDVNGRELTGIASDVNFGQRFLPDNHFVTQTASAGVDARLARALTLSSVTGLYAWRARYANTNFADVQPNGDFTVTGGVSNYTSRILSNTTYLRGDARTGAVTHTVTAGANVQAQTFDQVSRSSIPADACTSNFYRPAQCADVLPPVAPAAARYTDDRQWGLFLADELRLDRWRLLLALRHSAYREKLAGTRTSATRPTVGLTYDVAPAASVYASYGSGLEQGGVAPDNAVNAHQQLGPQDSYQVEVGAKSDLVGGRVTLDGALFQIAKTGQFLNAGNYFVQGGREVHTGGELRLRGKLAPDLTVSTGVQLLDAVFKDDPATDGQRAMNVPKVNATLWGDYRVRPVRGLFANGSLFYTGRREITVPNVAAKAPGYTRLDLGARYETALAGRGLTARVNVENVTDRTYYSSGWYSLYEFGAPRSVSASLQVSF